MEAIGWIGTFLYAVAGWPQAINSIRRGNSDGVRIGFLSMVIVGGFLHVAYSLHLDSSPLVVCNTSTILAMGVVMKYRLAPRRIS